MIITFHVYLVDDYLEDTLLQQICSALLLQSGYDNDIRIWMGANREIRRK